VTTLRQRMLEDLQIRNYAPTTIAAYIRGVAGFAKHFGKPDQLGPEHIRQYQLFLSQQKRASLSTYIHRTQPCTIRLRPLRSSFLPTTSCASWSPRQSEGSDGMSAAYYKVVRLFAERYDRRALSADPTVGLASPAR
jgi:hypothetical protein